METKVAEKSKYSERIKRLRQKVIEEPQSFDSERYKFLLETYREAEGLPTVLKRAKLFEKILTQKTICIDDNPIVGSQGKKPSAIFAYPETACRWMRRELDDYCGVMGRLEKRSEEDNKIILETVDYWQDKCMYTRAHQDFREAFNVDATKFMKAGVWSDAGGVTVGTVNFHYEKLMTRGLKGIIADAEEKLAELTLGTVENLNKRHFYKAVIICLNAMITWAKRYSDLAGEMAKEESNQERKKELEQIAETCQWVPANRPRSFYEALQFFWFIHVAAWIETGPLSIAPGRFPQYMYPFYKKDKEEGKITDEEAIELLELLFVHFLDSAYMVSGRMYEHTQGHTGNIIVLGGLTPDGKDATNELDWFLLEAQRRVKLVQPTLQLFYHDKMSEEFLFKALELIRDVGLGQPSFHNTDVTIKRNLFHLPGIDIEEARDTSQAGCIQSTIQGKTANTWEMAPNIAKMMELALNNGKDPGTGWQLGPETGDAESFQSYDEVWEAVEKQIQYFIPLGRQLQSHMFALHAEIMPTPFQSSLVDDCIEKGKDVMEGGAKYSFTGSNPAAAIDVANSLAAIKKLVFEEKRFSMKKLKAALAADFEGDGYHEIQRMCMDAPKFGNDDEYVDQIAADIYDLIYDAHQTLTDWVGRHSVPQAFSITNHAHFGLLTGALPDGRKAGVSLTDASVSANPGTDVSGPTALAKSGAKAIDCIKYGSNHFNMKFHPSALSGKEGLRKLLALIKTYMDLGGYHVQFNCVSGEALKDAQLHPENHKDLVVRVAGFSAFFVHLDKSTQEEVIKRTELQFT